VQSMKGKNKTIAIVVGIASDLINDGKIILDIRNGVGWVGSPTNTKFRICIKVKWFGVVVIFGGSERRSIHFIARKRARK